MVAPLLYPRDTHDVPNASKKLLASLASCDAGWYANASMKDV